MGENENTRVVKEAYAAFGRGDIPGLLELCSADIDWNTPGAPDSIPYAGRKRGHEEVKSFFSVLAASEEITHFEPQEFIAEGDKVVVIGNYKGQVLSTKNEYDLDWLHVFNVSDGKITSFREYIDTAALGDAYRAAAAKVAG